MKEDTLHEQIMQTRMQQSKGKGLHTSRRKQIRYPLRASVVYRWLDPTGLRRRGRGWTRDISEAGTYVLSQRCPNEGDVVELRFRLVSTRQQLVNENGTMDMNGRVIRVDRDGNEGAGAGFAVRSKETASPHESDDSFIRYWQRGVGPAVLRN
jgi:hypothetical protein